MITGKWIIPEEYGSEDHLGKGYWEGECVYVLAWDKENKRMYCAKGHAFASKKKILAGFGSSIIVSSTNGYYDKIQEMVSVSSDYSSNKDEKEIYYDFIDYIFRVVNWKVNLS